jgi:hypothetical protein
MIQPNFRELVWNTSTLQSLCTSSCESSLSDLANAAESACVNDTFTVDGNTITLSDLISSISYKFGLICLQDEASQDFCVDVESSCVTFLSIVSAIILIPSSQWLFCLQLEYYDHG